MSLTDEKNKSDSIRLVSGSESEDEKNSDKSDESSWVIIA